MRPAIERHLEYERVCNRPIVQILMSLVARLGLTTYEDGFGSATTWVASLEMNGEQQVRYGWKKHCARLDATGHS
jgi:hypothetical protein